LDRTIKSPYALNHSFFFSWLTYNDAILLVFFE